MYMTLYMYMSYLSTAEIGPQLCNFANQGPRASPGRPFGTGPGAFERPDLGLAASSPSFPRGAAVANGGPQIDAAREN